MDAVPITDGGPLGRLASVGGVRKAGAGDGPVASYDGGSSKVRDSGASSGSSSGGAVASSSGISSPLYPSPGAGSTLPGDDTTGNDASGATGDDATLGADGELGTGDDAASSCAQTCTSGCCDSTGACNGGADDTACGTSGAACQDCTGNSQTCQANACAARTTSSSGGSGSSGSGSSGSGSSGGSGCNASSCTNLCVPYFVQCCKSDNSCGCALLFPRGSCN